MKHTDLHLDFLRSKIEAACTALCTLDHPAFWIKTHIIHTIKVDEDGHIWFKIMQPSSKVAIDLHSFSISLSYYKKKLGYSLKVDALATAFEDDGLLWIKAKIIKAEYAENNAIFEQKNDGNFLYSISRKFMQMASSLF